MPDGMANLGAGSRPDPDGSYLIPIARFLGLGGFLWALRCGQFDDPGGAAERILFEDEA
ncbi:MAG TPA: cbb3-type cytochrome oxidase assembly protein CcoS [Thermomicrobiales bacterium]|nr:cbb3-type cytochrome oxidase assembly protein CcoS [Thermomicrobiales bacterium]